MEKKIIFTPVEPNRNLLWLHYREDQLVLEKFGSNGWESIGDTDYVTEEEFIEALKNKADLVGGKVPAEELPSYVDDIIEFNNIQVADAEISSIIGNKLYKNQIRFVNNSTTLTDRIGSEGKYPNMFVNFGENTSEDDWTTFEPEQGKIYINTTNNHSYRWSGSQLIDLDQSWSNDIKDLQENTVSIKSQTLTEAQQAQVWQNLGLDLVVLKFPKGVTSITLTDEEDAKLQSGAAVLVTADSADTTGNIYNANNHIFTTIDFKNTSQPLYYSLALFSGLLYCSYNKVSKKFTYQGIIRLIDTGALRFDRLASLTASQKDTALSNIGLGFVIVDYSELSTTLSDDRLSQLVNAKGFILTNTPDDYTRAVVFTAGTRLVNSIIFSSVEDAKNINYIVLNIPNKALSLVQTSKLVISNFNQNLTNTEKDTVLSNIGLNWIHVQYSLLNTTLDDATYTKLTNAYGIILTDAPSEYYGPLEFICSANNSDGTKVFAGLNLANTSAYIALYTNHRLSTVRYLRTYDGAVPYDASKTLTSDQQDVALSNIGLNFVHVDYSLLGTTLTDAQAQSIVNSRGIILTNVPENSAIPTVYLKGLNDNNYCYFLTINGNTIISQISFNKGTKALSNSLNTDLHFDSVRYNVTQTLTNTQKQQARTNIGVKSADELLEDADFIAQLKTKLETV